MTRYLQAPFKNRLLPKLLLALVAAAASPLFMHGATSPCACWCLPLPAAMDIVARAMADQLSADIGQPVIVDNKPGAGGGIAVQPDNRAEQAVHHVVAASNVLTEIPHLMKTGLIRSRMCARRPGGALKCGAGGGYRLSGAGPQGRHRLCQGQPGQAQLRLVQRRHQFALRGAIFNQKAGLDLQHVPVSGLRRLLVQVMGGQVALMFDGMATSLPQIKGGKLKAFGVGSKTRSVHLPDVPTMAELGYPDIDFTNWIGTVVASGVPVALVDKINAAAQGGGVTKVRERLAAAGFEPNVSMTLGSRLGALGVPLWVTPPP